MRPLLLLLLLAACTSPVAPGLAPALAFRPAVESTGRIGVSLQSDTDYSWRFEGGSMLVTIGNAPAGRLLIQAREGELVQGFTVWDLPRERPLSAVVTPYPGLHFGPGSRPVFFVEVARK